MEDAGGDNVQEHVKAAETQGEELPTEGLEGNDHARMDPNRYWFISSAIPLIAGTLGPVANAFSICALVRPWRQHFPPGSDVDKAPYVSDPIWLTTINAVQVALSVIANVFLLLNMARRVRFTIAQPVTIIGWYISSFCLIALLATAAGPLIEQPKSEYIWSQAYYYGIYAASLYFFCSTLMILTFVGAQAGRFSKDFQLTTSQRTLMLQTILFLMYLLVGALIFSTVEGWTYLDAVYWADVTLFTVGFGDFAASTTLGRALLFPYALVGIISLGLVIGSIRSLALDRGKEQFDARIIEKRRRTLVRKIVRKGRDDVLTPITDDDGDRSLMSVGTGLTEFERREREFKLMRKIQHQAARRRRWTAMGISSSTWVLLWVIGAVIFWQCELRYQNWTYFDGIYFCFVSLTTIGYGDITPISPAGKSFFVFWSLLALPATTVLISNAGDTIVKGIRDSTNYIGSITILPGEGGFKKDAKELLSFFGLEKIFTEDIKDSPPGFLGDAEPHTDDSEDSEDDEKIDELPGDERETGALDKEVRGATGTRNTDDEREEGQSHPENQPDGEEDTDHDHPDRAGSWRTSDSTQVDRIRIQEPDKPRRPSTGPDRKNKKRKSSTSSDSIYSRPAPNHKAKSANDINSNTVSMNRAMSMPRQDIPMDVPANRSDYHVVLVDEIARVTQHLKSHPPRKYTFQEWAWYLKLIGEDEGSPQTHRKAQPYVHRRDTSHSQDHQDHHHHRHLQHHHHHHQQEQQQQQQQQPQYQPKVKSPLAITDGASGGSSNAAEAKSDLPREEEDGVDMSKPQWSWVGSKSPLMSSQEEAEWILEKLTQRLAEELRSVRNEDQEQRKRSHEKGKGRADDDDGDDNGPGRDADAPQEKTSTN